MGLLQFGGMRIGKFTAGASMSPHTELADPSYDGQKKYVSSSPTYWTPPYVLMLQYCPETEQISRTRLLPPLYWTIENAGEFLCCIIITTYSQKLLPERILDTYCFALVVPFKFTDIYKKNHQVRGEK